MTQDHITVVCALVGVATVAIVIVVWIRCELLAKSINNDVTAMSNAAKDFKLWHDRVINQPKPSASTMRFIGTLFNENYAVPVNAMMDRVMRVERFLDRSFKEWADDYVGQKLRPDVTTTAPLLRTASGVAKPRKRNKKTSSEKKASSANRRQKTSTL